MEISVAQPSKSRENADGRKGTIRGYVFDFCVESTIIKS